MAADCDAGMTRSDIGRRSRNKGAAFERIAARELAAWWGSGPGSFRRTPLSGGWDRTRAAGDLLVPDDFPWAIECKSTKTWSVEQLLTGRGALLDYWRQACEAAAYSAPPRLPVLLLCRRGIGTLAMLRHGDLPADRIGPFPQPQIRGMIEGEAVIICRLDVLLRDVDPEAIRIRKVGAS